MRGVVITYLLKNIFYSAVLISISILSSCFSYIDSEVSNNNDVTTVGDRIIRTNDPDAIMIDDVRTTGQWYKGDLHMHSKFRGNDQFPNGSVIDNGDRSVGEMLDIVRDKGFDFVTITDHDFLPDFIMFDPMDGDGVLPLHWIDPEYQADDMVLLYGMEYTAIGGHANIWSDKIFDYGEIWKTHDFRFKNYSAIFLNFLLSSPNWDDVVEAAHASGALFSINHPGEGWLNKRPGKFDSMEVWNSPFYLPDRFNRYSVNSIWSKYLLQGRRVSAVGGSDKHRFNKTKSHTVGQPSTWVFSREKNAKSILEAIKAGRVSISYTSEAGYLEFAADADSNGTADVISGDNITVDDTKNIEFSFRYVEPGTPDTEGEIIEISKEAIDSLDDGIDAIDGFIHARYEDDSKILVLYKNGRRYKVWILKNKCNTVNFTESIKDGKKVYYRVELFGKTNWPIYLRMMGGRMIGMTNPIYFNY